MAEAELSVQQVCVVGLQTWQLTTWQRLHCWLLYRTLFWSQIDLIVRRRNLTRPRNIRTIRWVCVLYTV